MEREATTGGGYENIVGMAILGLLVAGSSDDLIRQAFVFLYYAGHRLAHLFEKFLEFIAALFNRPFSATPLGDGYPTAVSDTAVKSRQLIVVAVFVVVCTLAVGGAKYGSGPRHPPSSVQRNLAK